MNTDAIKTEIASCEAVTTEYLESLAMGAVDLEKTIPELLSKLKAAGSDKIIEEAQKQIDAWKAEK